MRKLTLPIVASLLFFSAPAFADGATVQRPRKAARAPVVHTEPQSPERSCKKDADCVIRQHDPCACPACGPRWHSLLNEKSAKALRRHYAQRRCPAVSCAPCAEETLRLGSKTFCNKGQCAIRETRAGMLAWLRDHRCRTDAECVVAYDPCGYRAKPCRDRFKPAFNRSAESYRRARFAKKKIACRSGVHCRRGQGGRRGKWIGSRAVCVQGFCRTKK